jgi:hypothetical protein
MLADPSGNAQRNMGRLAPHSMIIIYYTREM